MTMITRPLDAAVAHSLQTISAWAAEELTERLRQRALHARVGYSNQSCSTYVDVQIDDELALCVRISDHEAKSYNRAGDYRIALGHRDADAHRAVAIRKLYDGERVVPIDFDEDGDPIDFVAEYFLTDDDGEMQDGGWQPFELAGYRADDDDLIAAVAAAEAFVLRHV